MWNILYRQSGLILFLFFSSSSFCLISSLSVSASFDLNLLYGLWFTHMSGSAEEDLKWVTSVSRMAVCLPVAIYLFFFFLFYLFQAEVFSSVNRHTEVSVAQLVVISWISRWNDRIPWAYPYSVFLYLSNTLSFLPRRHKQKDLRGNLCRNPDNSTTGPWCFTKNPSIRYQNCNIPQCSQGKLPVTFCHLYPLNNLQWSCFFIWFLECFLWGKDTFC